MTDNRLDPRFGCLLDRAHAIRFRFNGRACAGFAGDTIASALIANGIWASSVSLRRHRTRGLHAFGEAGSEAWVTLPDAVHAAVDTTLLHDDMALASGGGGGGRRSRLPDVTAALPGPRWPAEHVHTDIAVIGGGPAGIAAAIAAADAGREVILVERLPLLGGSLLYGRLEPEGRTALARRAALIAALEARNAVQVWTGTLCASLQEGPRLQLVARDRRAVLHADAVVLATGSVGQRLVFRDNDLPGVLQARAAEQLVHLYGVRPGARAVVVTADMAGFGTALTLLDAGVEVPAVLDMVGQPWDEPLRRAVSSRGVPIFRGHTVMAGLPADGGTRLGAVVAAPVAGPDRVDQDGLRIMCEALCVSAGWQPAVSLAAQAGAGLRYDRSGDRLMARDLPPGLFLAGAAAGVADLADAELDGVSAGTAAAQGGRPVSEAMRSAPPNLAWPLVADPRRHGMGSEFVDIGGDLTRAELAAGTVDGLATPKDAVGLRRIDLAEVATLHRLLTGSPERAAAAQVAWSAPAPAATLPLGLLADPLALPARHGPLDAVHRDAGADMMAVGSWLVPAVYPGAGPRADAGTAVTAEVRAVREHVGLMDRSDLGKLLVAGAGAAALLDRTITGHPGAMDVGAARIARLRGAAAGIGAVVVARLGDDDFLLTTYADRAAELMRAFDMADALRTDADVVDITSAYAILAVAGPGAAALMAGLGGPARLGDMAQAAGGVAAARIAGIRLIVLRSAAVGEPTFELVVTAGFAATLWERIAEAGGRFGLRRVGRRAERLLRLERGYPPCPAALDLAARSLPGFRLVRVGFTVAKGVPAPDQAVLGDDGRVVGRVLAAARSPTLGRYIGLAALDADNRGDGRILIAQPVGPAIVGLEASGPFYRPVRRRTGIAPSVRLPQAGAGETPLRRSPVHDRLAEAGARFMPCAGGLLAHSFATDGANYGVPVALVDLSPLPRLGLATTDAAAALRLLGFPSPAGIGAAVRCDGLVGVLVRPAEALVLPDPTMPRRAAEILVARVPDDACPGLLRGDMEAWFAVTGRGAANCLAGLGFGDLRVSRLAEETAISVRLDGSSAVLIRESGRFHLLVETSLAHHMWARLSAAVRERGGRVMGSATLEETWEVADGARR